MSVNKPGIIFLIGFMGCGKTTLGRKLSNRLGYPLWISITCWKLGQA